MVDDLNHVTARVRGISFLPVPRLYRKGRVTNRRTLCLDQVCFSRNIRAIEVLIDQQAISSGAAASGSPWRYYDLGHGWCSYEFFDQRPHRMACARCEFYVPKISERGRWLETREGLLKMLQEIPLSDEKRAAVDGDVQALDRLLERLATVPTPSGSLPGESVGTFIPLNALQASMRQGS